MADLRNRQGVKIVDPTTDGRQAAVTAGGALSVDVATIAGTAPTTVGKLDVKAADGDVFVRQASAANLNATVVGTGTFAVQDNQVIVDNAAFTDGTSKVFMQGYIFDETAGTGLTENDAAAARVNANRAQVFTLEDNTTRGQRAAIDASGRLSVSLTASSATVTVDTELLAVAALADATANPTITQIASYMLGFNGTTWDRVRTANTGRLQVDVISGGSSYTPTAALKSQTTSAALAAGSNVVLNSTQVSSGKTAKLLRLSVSSSVALKVLLGTVLNNAAQVTFETIFVPPTDTYVFDTPHPNFVTQAESVTAGIDCFQASITNMDNNSAADVYASFMWDEV